MIRQKSTCSCLLRFGFIAPLLFAGIHLLLFSPAEVNAGPRDRPYKRVVYEPLIKLINGQTDRALSMLRQRQEQYPDDPEFHYALALTHGQRGQIDTAVDHVRTALEKGLPFERFQAGPRYLIAPLLDHEEYLSFVRKHGDSLVHGPMVGSVTARRAKFWVRTARESSVTVRVRPADGDRDPRTVTARSQRERDYTAVAGISGLTPDTRYRYSIVIDGEKRSAPHWSFRTFPREGEPASFRIGFAGCAGYTPWNERIWRTIAERDFPAFLLTGDNVYIDQPKDPLAQKYCYYRRQSRPEFRRFTSSSSIFAVWDDHDFGTNDSRGGPAVDSPPWKLPVWRTFRNNWVNPAYGTENAPGTWFDLSIADVDVFMLDDRMYRTVANMDTSTMLGPSQKNWLKNKLKASDATFKLLVTSVPWAYGAKPGSPDPWQGFKQERKELFTFLHENRIEGVILLSGDRHRADVWKIDRETGYDLYEFQNAKLTNIHTHKEMPDKALFSYNKKNMFGSLSFDTTREDPTVTYKIITIDNEVVHSFTVKKSQLSYP